MTRTLRTDRGRRPEDGRPRAAPAVPADRATPHERGTPDGGARMALAGRARVIPALPGPEKEPAGTWIGTAAHRVIAGTMTTAGTTEAEEPPRNAEVRPPEPATAPADRVRPVPAAPGRTARAAVSVAAVPAARTVRMLRAAPKTVRVPRTIPAARPGPSVPAVPPPRGARRRAATSAAAAAPVAAPAGPTAK